MFLVFFFFFNDTATTEIYTLSLHDALPIYRKVFETLAASQTVEKLIGLPCCWRLWMASRVRSLACSLFCAADRKSTRLNSSHVRISYAVFCLKKKKGTIPQLGAGRTRQR